MTTRTIPVINMMELWSFTSETRTYHEALKDAVFDLWANIHPDRRSAGHWIIPANRMEDLLSMRMNTGVGGIPMLMFDAETLGFVLLGACVVIDKRRGDCLRFVGKDDQ